MFIDDNARRYARAFMLRCLPFTPCAAIGYARLLLCLRDAVTFSLLMFSPITDTMQPHLRQCRARYTCFD